MSSIKTAVIPAGGYGTRFLPATKSIPKEMFPLGNKPVILHVVEEVVASGIENIIFVVSHHKQSIESFFAPNEILEEYYLHKGKKKQVKVLQEIEKMANFTYVYTKPPYGNGGALLSAQHLLGDEPFVLVWSDEVILTKGKPRVQQCIDTFEKYHQPVISAVAIENPNDRSQYGMAKMQDISGEQEIKEIVKIVEKPPMGKEPSIYAAHGAYILPPEIFASFERVKPGKGGELWLTDLINDMKKETGLLAKIIPDALYLDCGSPMHYLFSQFTYALANPDSSKEINAFLSRNVCPPKK